MRGAIRQGVVSLAVFIVVIALVQLVAHVFDPSRPLWPSDERALLLISLAFMFAVFSGFRKARAS